MSGHGRPELEHQLGRDPGSRRGLLRRGGVGCLRDPWDRLITATAIDLGAPLVTKDRAITAIGQAGPVEIIW